METMTIMRTWNRDGARAAAEALDLAHDAGGDAAYRRLVAELRASELPHVVDGILGYSRHSMLVEAPITSAPGGDLSQDWRDWESEHHYARKRGLAQRAQSALELSRAYRAREDAIAEGASVADVRAAMDAAIEAVRLTGVNTEDHDTLYDYETAEPIRPATADEQRESQEQAERDGGAGVIEVEGRSCYVVD